MKKRIIALVLAMVLAMGLCVPAAAAYTENVSINYRAIKLVLNGEQIVPCDGAGNTVEPFIMASSGTTYLPLRAVAQALGLNVKWDGAANTVTLDVGGTVKTGEGPAGTTMGQQKVGITYRNIKIFLNGEELNLVNANGDRVEPFILNSNSSVYLPLRVIGEALGLKVGWDSATSTVSLEGAADESGVTDIGFPVDTVWLAPGESAEQVAQFNEGAKDMTVVWTSSNEDIATVEDMGTMEFGAMCRIVASGKEGDAVITATAVNGKSAECTVHVYNSVLLYKPDDTVMEVDIHDIYDYIFDGWDMEKVGRDVVYDSAVSDPGIRNPWSYGDGYLYIGGNGTIGYDDPWTKYKQDTHTAYLKHGLTEVDSFMFDGWSKLTRVEVPDTATFIDGYAFDECALTRLGIPANVTRIDDHMLDVYEKPLNSSNRNVNIYCEPGSAAEEWAQEYGLAYTYASIVYFPDGRTCMVSADERDAFLKGGWYSYPVTVVYDKDTTAKIIPESELSSYLDQGWVTDVSELYITMYAADGRTKEVLKINVEKEQSVGWYLYHDYIGARADYEVNNNGWEAGVSFIEETLYKVGEDDPYYSSYVAKKTQIINNWRADVGAPIVITGYSFTWNSIGVPVVTIRYRNLSNNVITSLEAFWTNVDPYGNPTADFWHLNGTYNGWMNGIKIQPGQEAGYSWTLYNYEQTTDVKGLRMVKCAFADGTAWYYPNWYNG